MWQIKFPALNFDERFHLFESTETCYGDIYAVTDKVAVSRATETGDAGHNRNSAYQTTVHCVSLLTVHLLAPVLGVGAPPVLFARSIT